MSTYRHVGPLGALTWLLSIRQVSLIVHGGYREHLRNIWDALGEHVPQEHRINCHEVNCRSVPDLEAFKQGGGCAVLQHHVLRQAALVDVMTTALTIIAEKRTGAAVRRLSFVCEHGKHRSRTCAEMFRALFAPRTLIYSARDDLWC